MMIRYVVGFDKFGDFSIWRSKIGDYVKHTDHEIILNKVKDYIQHRATCPLHYNGNERCIHSECTKFAKCYISDDFYNNYCKCELYPQIKCNCGLDELLKEMESE